MGAVAGAAGSLHVSAPQGTFSFAGSNIHGAAPAGQQQGSFTLDVGHFDNTGFGGVEALLAAAGFTDAVDVRTRNDGFVAVD